MAELDPKVRKQIDEILNRVGVPPDSDLATQLVDKLQELSGEEMDQLTAELTKFGIIAVIGYLGYKFLKAIGMKI